jgi:lipopolysaccharide exporter
MSKLSALRNGIGWGGASLISNTAVQVFYMAIMARLLNPSDFGLMAMAGVALRFLGYFAQIGITPAVIQKPTLTKSDIGAAITISTIAGIICFGLVVLLSPLMGWVFGQRDLQIIIIALASNFVLIGIGAVPNGLLRRALNFKRVAMIDTIAYGLSYTLVGLVLANLGAGVWALVGATLAQTLTTIILAGLSTKESLTLRHESESRKFFIQFGRRHSTTGFLEFLTSSMDSMVIGRMLGPAAAGIYSRATLLANLPVSQPVNILTNSLFPILSSMSSEKSKISSGLQISLLAVGGFALMTSLAIRQTSPEIVTVLLGSKWMDAVSLLQVLSIYVAPNFINHVISITLDSIGELRIRMAVQITSLLTLGPLLYLGYQYGLIGIAVAMATNECLRSVMLFAAAKSRLQMSMAELAKCIASIAIMGMICALSLNVMRGLWADSESAILKLVLDVPATIISMVFGLITAWFLVRKIDAIKYIMPQFPMWLQRAVRY